MAYAKLTATGKTLQTHSTARCRVMGAMFDNANATKAYLQVFDAAAADVTLGTTVPKLIVPIASLETLRVMGLELQMTGPALSAAVTTTPTGSTLVTTDGMLCLILE